MWVCINIQKFRLFHWFVLEIWLIKKSFNLIGWEHFGLYFRNKIFPNMRFIQECSKWYKFSLQNKFSKNSWPNFSINSKSLFCPILGPFSNFRDKNIFPENLALSNKISYRFLAPCQNLEKTNDTIPRKCPDRKRDGWTDRLYFIGPFSCQWGFSKRLNNCGQSV